ncbi:MAG: substrate-binding domain-containing protein, partial [Armatimonadota bacterium]
MANDLRFVYEALEKALEARQPQLALSVVDGGDAADVAIEVGGDGVEFARVPLILLVPKGNPLDIRGIGDLADARVESIVTTEQMLADVRDALGSAGILDGCAAKLRDVAGQEEAAGLVAEKKANIAILPATYL